MRRIGSQFYSPRSERRKTSRRLSHMATLLGASGIALSAGGVATAQGLSYLSFLEGLDPHLYLTGSAVLFAFSVSLWAVRVTAETKNMAGSWSRKLTQMEADLEKSESILSAHPGLVLVWDDAFKDIEEGWGKPRMLGGPAAMASLLTFVDETVDAALQPADSLLNTLGELPLEDDTSRDDIQKLKHKVQELRRHGIAFSGSVVTDEGRSIEVDGRVAGDQVTLWLTDPAVRLAEDGGVLGQTKDRAADLHGALNQLNKAPVAAWRRGADLKLEWVNERFVEMVEAINREEVIENQIEIDSAFRKVAEHARTEHARTGRHLVDDMVVVNVRGARRVLRVIEMPMHTSGDAALSGMAIDVTKLDKASEDLRRHQHAHRSTLDQMPSAVAVFNSAQQLDYYNHAFSQLWRLDDAELRSRPSHGEILDKLRQNGRLPEQSDFSTWKMQQLHLYTDGALDANGAVEIATPDEIWNLPNGKTLRVARQRHPLGGVVLVFEDITEKLKLEMQYNTQIGVQRATLNNLAEGVAVFASDGVLRLYNSAFQNLWRFEPGKLSELPAFDDLAAKFEKQSDGTTELWQDLKRRITSFTIEERKPLRPTEVALRDNRAFSLSTTPLPDGATLVTFLDITDSKEREKELQERNEWLETADRIKSKFVNHISYNLRNPLNTIIGFSEMLETEMFGPLNERQKDYAASILSASNHLLDLINDIIDLAAIDAGKLDLALGTVDVRQVLENTATYAALKAEDSRVTLTLECDADAGEIVADERRLKQALFNLLANAFAYTQEGGTVTLGASKDAETVRIWVRDTGRGVSKEDQAKAFDRFESRGPGAGAGLGLSLVKSFIELHGGWVRLSSDEGEGTIISCYLPADGPLVHQDDDTHANLLPEATNKPALVVENAASAPATRTGRRRKNKSRVRKAASSRAS